MGHPIWNPQTALPVRGSLHSSEKKLFLGPSDPQEKNYIANSNVHQHIETLLRDEWWHITLTYRVLRSWSRIFFSISASVSVSRNGHHWSASAWLRTAISTTGSGASLHMQQTHHATCCNNTRHQNITMNRHTVLCTTNYSNRKGSNKYTHKMFTMLAHTTLLSSLLQTLHFL